MSNQQKNNEEEVDLGSLFVIIGKEFRNFFNFIGGIFKGVFHFVISVLIFVKRNMIILAAATFLGIIIGFILDYNKPIIFDFLFQLVLHLEFFRSQK